MGKENLLQVFCNVDADRLAGCGANVGTNPDPIKTITCL